MKIEGYSYSECSVTNGDFLCSCYSRGKIPTIIEVNLVSSEHGTYSKIIEIKQ